MTDRNSAPRNRSAVDMSTVIPWTNESGETIPAYGVVQLRTNFDGSSKASKPNAADGLFFVNGLVSIESTKAGESQAWNRPRPVLIDGSAAVGDEVGPVAGQWYMNTEGFGYRVLRQPEGGIGVVVQAGGGAAKGGAERIWFYIVDVYCPDTTYPDPCDKMYVEVVWTDYTGGCGAEPPGQDEYGIIRVYDRGVLEYYTAEQLLNGSHLGADGSQASGLMGSATYFYPRDGGACSYGCEPIWIIDSIIGNPECNDADVTDVGVSV